MLERFQENIGLDNSDKSDGSDNGGSSSEISIAAKNIMDQLLAFSIKQVTFGKKLMIRRRQDSLWLDRNTVELPELKKHRENLRILKEQAVEIRLCANFPGFAAVIAKAGKDGQAVDLNVEYLNQHNVWELSSRKEVNKLWFGPYLEEIYRDSEIQHPCAEIEKLEANDKKSLQARYQILKEHLNNTENCIASDSDPDFDVEILPQSSLHPRRNHYEGLLVGKK
ncbi:hypothetical protein OCU04_002434 [Sclerotinia nivalis]|uniref:Uncharacterized protein n=1 Tax=Sclerotinia nivalis TaxID=352851 RepID=A0A9X0ATL0_9HELO|nr:hypothetical protein OCU04_002434 [Sclerotinia nivalis]